MSSDTIYCCQCGDGPYTPMTYSSCYNCGHSCKDCIAPVFTRALSTHTSIGGNILSKGKSPAPPPTRDIARTLPKINSTPENYTWKLQKKMIWNSNDIEGEHMQRRVGLQGPQNKELEAPEPGVSYASVFAEDTNPDDWFQGNDASSMSSSTMSPEESIDMKLIRKCITSKLNISEWPDPGTKYHVYIEAEWSVKQFLEDQYEGGLQQDLGKVLAIIGTSVNAQLISIEAYFRQVWPIYSSSLLRAIRFELGQDSRISDADMDGSLRVWEGSPVHMFAGVSFLVADIDGPLDFLVAVAQQLAFLSAACRVATDGLTYSRTKFHERSLGLLEHLGDSITHHFLVKSPTTPVGAGGPKSCWNEIIGSSVIVTGFPIANRSVDYVGLSAPLELLANFIGAPHATKYDGGFVIKGRRHAIIPVRRTSACVQWHLVCKNVGKLDFDEIDERISQRLSFHQLNEADLMSTKAFLGWCFEAKYYLGTRACDYARIGSSSAPRYSETVLKIAGGSFGFSHLGVGQINFTIGRKDGLYSAESSLFYQDRLDDARGLQTILYDEQTKCAWQTDSERLILNAILHRHHVQPFKIDNETVSLISADPESPESVREAMCENANKVVAKDWRVNRKGIQERTFLDLFQELLSTIEGLQANLKKTTDYAIAIGLLLDHTHQLVGWNYMDLVNRQRDLYPRQKRLKSTCGNWPAYARDIKAVILFGRHFPDVFTPKYPESLCSACQQLPKDKDYLAVEASTLKALQKRAWETSGLKAVLQKQEPSLPSDSPLLISTGYLWRRSTHVFESCEAITQEGDDTTCNDRRLQGITRLSRSNKCQAPSEIDSRGVVVFGEPPSSLIQAISRALQSLRLRIGHSNKSIANERSIDNTADTDFTLDLPFTERFDPDFIECASVD